MALTPLCLAFLISYNGNDKIITTETHLAVMCAKNISICKAFRILPGTWGVLYRYRLLLLFIKVAA